MTTPEGKVKAMVKRRLERVFGDECWRFMPVQMGRGAPALDFLLCVRGKFAAIETKVPGSSMTPRQEATSNEITRAGGLVCTVYDETSLDQAIAAICLFAEFG